MALLRSALFLQSIVSVANSQTFFVEPFTAPYHRVKDPLSQQCRDTMKTTLECSWTLQTVTQFDPPVGYANTLVVLEDICRPKCRQDLVEWRQRLASQCKSTDMLGGFENNASYPTMFIPDNYLWVYDTYCYKSKTDGQFCYVVENEIGLYRNETKVDVCSDCFLGVLATELNSPVGYTDELVAEFSSATEKCSATGYSYTKTSYSDPTPTAGSGGPAFTSATGTSTGAPASATTSRSISATWKVLDLKRAMGLVAAWVAMSLL
ncbi:hypothetical protein B0T14DRAFT_565459 [Immersiella caudata]|uniref:Uncharacterized protein n=1 Tax=Immersiella caudata TaxID=314043 RepID=A0AA39WYY0_9PEZI|nr:hypothetical protein B0T14DRAFT_565459 [Immersiella caudata]